MLDNTTRKRIDDCRDILVGKLPDPKSQIEQITIALIYKFMDDMDKESIELGGEAKFFSGDFEKYSWDSLFDAKVTATEMLKLYSESIESMEKNPNIPQLFRDIFKNAYLPYRDPETLKLFLKTIGEFEYTHSEKLGDAFEYLLSVMGSQGDAGQFRTPRHIIDFLVEAVDPSKTDTILDPACGTAGFLISAFKHVRSHAERSSGQAERSRSLTPDERTKLIKNFIGYDISPDMVRLSLVNLYLHGFSDPHIFEYDTLTSEERWNDSFDVVLANPPFMSPKGGIRPHKKFTVTSNRSEVLFVDYIAEHLNPNGRAGIIVPEGVIFQSGKAYKQLRKMLVENYLYAVVSLPAGVFNPYSGVKTSILLMDKAIAKKTNKILFVKIDNDGYNLGAQRNKIKGGQLGEAIEVLINFKDSIESSIDFEIGQAERSRSLAHAVEISKIADNGEFNLSGERYKAEAGFHSNFPIVKIEEISKINPLKSQIKNLPTDTLVSFLPMADLNENKINFQAKQKKYLKDVFKGYTYFEDNDVLIAKVTPCFENGKAGVAKNLTNGIGFGSSEFYVLRTENNISPEFLYRVINIDRFKEYAVPKMTGTGGLRRVPKNVVAEFKIPLPPLSIQEEIVAEIEGYQKIIDGAKMVVENYKPQIEIDEDWEMVELQSISTKLGDGLHGTPKYSITGDYYFINGNNLLNSKITFKKSTKRVSFEEFEKYKKVLTNRTILVSINGTLGNVAIYNNEKVVLGKSVCYLNLKNDINKEFVKLYLQSNNFLDYAHRMSTGSTIQNVSLKSMREFNIPIPPIEIQQHIVIKIEKEQDLVNSSKQLIELFEQKIKDRIARVWGTSPSAS